MKKLKKYKLVNPTGQGIDYLFPDEIIMINPVKCIDGTVGMFIKYYDEEFCCISSIFCDKIIVEDFE